MKNLYNEDYFERGIELGISGYSNYRWMPELTIPMCSRMIEYLGIKENETILDFGCAKGYIVKALRLLHRKAYGYDTSKYALQHVDAEVKKFIHHVDNIEKLPVFDWVIAKDVLEHIEYNELDRTLLELRTKCSKMFCIIPLGKDNKYSVPSYENDKTHVVRQSIGWWQLTFEETGFIVDEATYKVKHIKENYAKWEEGNGFFTLRSNNV